MPVSPPCAALLRRCASSPASSKGGGGGGAEEAMRCTSSGPCTKKMAGVYGAYGL